MVFLVVGYFSYHIPNFKLDASAESLVLENDDSLEYYRKINKSYGSDDFLIITYAPFKDLMSDEVLADLKSISNELARLDRVRSTDSILNVPLLNSPRVEISKLATDIRTLETPGMDRELVRKEFLESPIYKNLLLSPDGKVTIIRINFKRDEKYFSLLYRRNDLSDKKKESGLSKEEEEIFAEARQEFRDYHAKVLDAEDKLTRYYGSASRSRRDVPRRNSHDHYGYDRLHRTRPENFWSGCHRLSYPDAQPVFQEIALGSIAYELLRHHRLGDGGLFRINGLAGDSYFFQFHFYSAHHYHVPDRTFDREVSGFKR